MKTARRLIPPQTLSSHLNAPAAGVSFTGVSFRVPGYRIRITRHGLGWKGHVQVGPRGFQLRNVGRSGTAFTDQPAPQPWTAITPERHHLSRRRLQARLDADLALVQSAHHQLTRSTITVHTTDPKDAS